MKILVVDDNHENVMLVRDVLEVSDYDVVEAYNGPQALEIAPKQQPDLILLDVNMPGMDGFHVCGVLKADEKTRHIPVIMLTAQSDIDSRVRGIEVGADDYLTKPYSPRELLARVERSLRSKVASDDMRATQELLREQQEVIKHTFSRFVARSVVDELLKDPSRIKLGGQLQAVTVLFADLQGFTSLSEDTEPQNLLQLLNSYHTFMVDFILKYGGTVDKFLGDGLMALYNTPIQQDDHIARAVKTALHIQDDIYWFTQELPEEHRLKINFGIHTGDAIVGNVGSDNLMDFTAVGDTVNVAARLQGLAENGEILVSAPIFEATQDFVFGRTRGHLNVKGRKETINAYQISNTYFE
ncbi:MAG: adenylate/guanylate cyclase domain-containing protein [Phototrophicaceae bacterium]